MKESRILEALAELSGQIRKLGKHLGGTDCAREMFEPETIGQLADIAADEEQAAEAKRQREEHAAEAAAVCLGPVKATGRKGRA